MTIQTRRTSAALVIWSTFVLTCLFAVRVSAAEPTKPTAAAVARPDAKAFVQTLHTDLDAVVHKATETAAMHKAIATAMQRHMDYEFMAESILAKRWAPLKPAQKTEFIDLLRRMVEKTYVKRFKPGHQVVVTYADRVREGKDGRVQVRSTITVKRTRADVWYSLRPADGGWRIYDIVVDEASQLRTYKRSFGKVLKKDGWDALISKMKKSASR